MRRGRTWRCCGLGRGGGTLGCQSKNWAIPRFALQEWLHAVHSEGGTNRYASECQAAGRSPWPAHVWLFICLFLGQLEVVFLALGLDKTRQPMLPFTCRVCSFLKKKKKIDARLDKSPRHKHTGFFLGCFFFFWLLRFSPIWLDLVLMENIFSGFPSVLWLPCLDFCWFKEFPDEHMSLLYVSNNVDLSGRAESRAAATDPPPSPTHPSALQRAHSTADAIYWSNRLTIFRA